MSIAPYLAAVCPLYTFRIKHLLHVVRFVPYSVHSTRASFTLVQYVDECTDDDMDECTHRTLVLPLLLRVGVRLDRLSHRRNGVLQSSVCPALPAFPAQSVRLDVRESDHRQYDWILPVEAEGIY